jgi:hydrogenase nickel incorporation protein HypB
MGRFHRHPDGTAHEHGDSEQGRAHDRGDHSGYETGTERVAVLERIFGENDRTAALNRAAFAAAGVRAINIMSSPGAGKTTLLESTLRRLAGTVRIGVIEGDIETSLDADRLGRFAVQVSLVNTGHGFGGECHLDAPMVRSALPRLRLADLDLLLIENVGNLVCPAEFDVGEHARVMVYAITEGEDKPLKYPVMFRSVDLVLINKIDLLPHLDADLELFRANLRAVNPAAATLQISARSGAGVDKWCDWLRAHLADVAPVAPVSGAAPARTRH